MSEQQDQQPELDPLHEEVPGEFMGMKRPEGTSDGRWNGMKKRLLRDKKNLDEITDEQMYGPDAVAATAGTDLDVSDFALDMLATAKRFCLEPGLDAVEREALKKELIEAEVMIDISAHAYRAHIHALILDELLNNHTIDRPSIEALFRVIKGCARYPESSFLQAYGACVRDLQSRFLIVEDLQQTP